MKNLRRIVILSVILFAFGSAGAQSQNPDLTGLWLLESEPQSQSYPVNISKKGNGWIGSSRGHDAFRLALNPAGLRNEWVGDLVTDQGYGVKGTVVSPSRIDLVCLKSGKTWKLTR